MKRPARWQVRMMRSTFGRAVLAPNLRFRVQKWRIESTVWGARAPLRIGILSSASKCVLSLAVMVSEAGRMSSP